MHDFWEGLVTFKVNTLVAGGMAIGTALLGIGGTIATYHARDAQIQIEITQTRDSVRGTNVRLDELERSVIRTEEQSKITNMLLKQLIERK